MPLPPDSTPPALLDGRTVDELVVPFVDTAQFDRVAPLTVQLARAWDVPVRLVHVTPTIESIDPRLREVAAELREGFADIRIGSNHLYGDDAATAIAATAGPHSLVVMPTEHIDRWRVKGSTAEDVVEHLGSPVLLVGPNVTSEGLWDRGVGNEVIIGVDGSTASEAGVAPALALAASTGARLWLVDVTGVRTVRPTGEAHPLPGRYMQRLAERARTADTSDVHARWEVIVGDDPIAALERFADRRRASFLVVTTKGRRSLQRTTMASVASGLAATSTRPVLVVTPPVPSSIEPAGPVDVPRSADVDRT